MKRFLPSNVTPILDYLISIGKELLSGIIQLVRITAIACVCIIALFFIVLLILMLLGYKVNGNPTEIAKRAADHIRVSDCDRIIAYGVLPLGPTSEAIRGDCRHQYVKFSQDPMICESLSPPQYAEYCVHDFWLRTINVSNCHWYKDNAVRCFEGAALTAHIFDCSDPSQRAVSDECKHRYAFKNKDPALCEGVINGTLRSVCKVRIDVWKRYPQLRSTIYFNDDFRNPRDTVKPTD